MFGFIKATFCFLKLFIIIVLSFSSCGLSLDDDALNQYKVTYHINGATSGIAPIDPIDYVEGDSAVVLGFNDITRDGYSVSHWNSHQDGSGLDYSPGELITVRSNITLYAKWSVVSDVDDDRVKIIITTQNGEDVSLNISPLLYNKEHVLTIEIDDALNDVYTTLFKFFLGGEPEHDPGYLSPGLYSTDGCGNDIPYMANSTSWVVNNPVDNLDWFAWSDGSHWLNYAQLDAIFESGFGIVSHGYYMHMNHQDMNPILAVNNFINWSESRYGFRPLYIVRPGGAGGEYDTDAWKMEWFDKGARFVTLGSGTASARTRIDNIDITSFLEPLQVGRQLIENKTSIEMMAYVDSMRAQAGKQWLRIFGHRIEIDTFIHYAELKDFFLNFNALYGKDGDDSIWVANINDLITYLYCRDTIQIDSLKTSNTTTFYIDYQNTPEFLSKRLISLNIETVGQISSVQIVGAKKNSNSEQLINIEF